MVPRSSCGQRAGQSCTQRMYEKNESVDLIVCSFGMHSDKTVRHSAVAALSAYRQTAHHLPDLVVHIVHL
jgi:hypothetical protein